MLSNANFYSLRAKELGIVGENGAAVVAIGSLTKIAFDNDIPGIGDGINDLLDAVNDGSSALSQSDPGLQPLEQADGGDHDSDDLNPASSVGTTPSTAQGVDLIDLDLAGAAPRFAGEMTSGLAHGDGTTDKRADPDAYVYDDDVLGPDAGPSYAGGDTGAGGYFLDAIT